MACSIGEGEAVLYRLHGVLRGIMDDDGGHGAPGIQRRGRGHGGVQGAQSIVMPVPEQEEVVKHSGRGHSFVIVSAAGRRRARRVWVERGPTGVPGHFLESWRGSGRALKARRGWDHPGVIASLRASMHGMASHGGVDAVRSVTCRGAPRPGRAR